MCISDHKTDFNFTPVVLSDDLEKAFRIVETTTMEEVQEAIQFYYKTTILLVKDSNNFFFAPSDCIQTQFKNWSEFHNLKTHPSLVIVLYSKDFSFEEAKK